MELSASHPLSDPPSATPAIWLVAKMEMALIVRQGYARRHQRECGA
jgi:hypothetical protein